MKKRSQSVNVKHRKISFGDFQTETIGISVKKILIEVPYNYDGFVYASDESRMLAEAGDFSFRLGPISAEYEDLFYGEKAQKLSEIWCTECIAGCSDCAYQQYCGADPVRNHTMQRDPYGFRPGSNLCLLHMQIIDFIFELIITRKKEILPVFQSWVSDNGGGK